MKRYKIIYADPPWMYGDKSQNRGGAERHYPCMTTQAICEIDIPADDDSVLLLWATYPQLEEAFQVIAAWGFVYKTCAFTWVKTNSGCGSLYMGMGHYTRSNAEICLLGIRGKGLPRKNAGIYNTQLHPRGRHSEKPDAFRRDIVKLFGDVPRLEMFARCAPYGWDVWGNEVDGRHQLDLLHA